MNCKNTKISQMPRADHLHGGDLIPIVQHGKNKTINIQDLVDLFRRILPPPPPGPCPHPWGPEPHPHPWPGQPWDHHHDCGNPIIHNEIDMANRARQDAAIAKASASAAEGRIAVLQKTADVALDSSNKALSAVKIFRGQIDQIRQLAAEQQWLKAEMRNDRRRINLLNDVVLVLIEKVKELERQAGLSTDVPEFGDAWLSQLQDPLTDEQPMFPDDPHHHHHHHHHHKPYRPSSIFDNDEEGDSGDDFDLPDDYDGTYEGNSPSDPIGGDAPWVQY